MPSMQQRYYDILMERCRNDRYPSQQLLNRLESAIYTPEQLVEYVRGLIDEGAAHEIDAKLRKQLRLLMKTLRELLEDQR